ncbi:hypothetical protein INR49_002192 [Caranx melampygus]|nr:hypothetical protein INR49_002192 [Caranx melampygus]
MSQGEVKLLALIHPRVNSVSKNCSSVPVQWYRLNSKTGKKEKERGDIQVTIQFTRDNLTASMFDLVMKDKGTSTFTKLKERMRGKRRASDEDSSSAVLPGGYGSLYRMRQRLPSDGGGEEDYEDDEGGEARRSKMRTFFLRGKLRKSSDTRSSTSLGSESSESSSRGGSLSPTAGISVVVSDLSNSPSNSSNLTVDNSPEHTANTSPKSSSLKCEFGDEAGEITIAVPQPTVCVNGSHAYHVQPLDPGSGKPADSLGLGLLQKSLPLSMSLQNLSPRASPNLPRGPVGDGRRWSFDKPDKEEKAAIAAALEQSAPMQGEEEKGGRLGLVVLPKAASTAELENHGKKQRRNLFSHGRVSQAKDGSEEAHAATEEKHRGWFGSKESHSKPSLVVSPKLEPSTDPHPPPLPSSHHPPGPPVPPLSLVSPLHHTNPFCHSQTTPPHISPCNPFFSLIQQNPFYDDMLTKQPLKPLLPPLPYLSSSRPPIAQLFPQASNTNHDCPTTEGSVAGTCAKSDQVVKVEKRPLPPLPTEREKPSSKKSANPFSSSGEPEPDSEWDDSFEAFAAGRLQSPEDLTTDCKTQQKTADDESREKGVDEFSSSIEELIVISVNNSTDVKVPATPDDELSSTLPVLHIITSSPDVKQSEWDSPCGDTSSGQQDARKCSPVPFGAFGDFLNASPGQDFDSTLLHAHASDQSSSSFLQSLYVSIDSQDYQTCESHPSSKCSSVSEPNETLHSANSTLCGELSEIQMTADADTASGLIDCTSACKTADGKLNQTDRSEESPCGVDDKASTLETNFMIGDDFGLQVLPAAPPDPHKSCNPEQLSAGGVESQQVVFDDEFSMRPQTKSATLHRSHSEGTLTSVFDELLLPSFGSDPGAIRDSSLAPPGPDLSYLTSFAPPLTPEGSSSPVALSSSPTLANASSGSPPITARAATPKPEKMQQQQQQQQQQAANQQNSPHPVKPLTTAILADEKRTEGRSVLATGLEKLKSTIHPGRSSQLSEQETERKKSLTEGAGSYYHLNHSELVALLVQREAELERQKAEFERQKVLLAKREVELRKLKPQVRDLEDYIDTLLVRIMEQKPTLLQVRSKFK